MNYKLFNIALISVIFSAYASGPGGTVEGNATFWGNEQYEGDQFVGKIFLDALFSRAKIEAQVVKTPDASSSSSDEEATKSESESEKTIPTKIQNKQLLYKLQ